jgi:hypothetical protein
MKALLVIAVFLFIGSIPVVVMILAERSGRKKLERMRK